MRSLLFKIKSPYEGQFIAYQVLEPLVDIINNNSFETGIFPEDLKQTVINQIFLNKALNKEVKQK